MDAINDFFTAFSSFLWGWPMIITDGRREAHVASAKAQDAVGEFQFLQQAFHMGQHFLM